MLTSKALHKKSSSTTRPPSGRRPGCTHINMVTIRSIGIPCDQCGKKPNTGLLFACEQDVMCSLPVVRAHNKLQKGTRRQSSQFRAMGFNQSIVQAVSRGQYTPAEMEVLKMQKLKAKQAIEESIILHKNSGYRNDTKLPPPGVHKDVKVTASHRRAIPMPEGLSDIVQPCHVKVCLGCRPMCRARSFVSFEAALNDDLASPTVWYGETMPVAKASVCRTLGLASHSSIQPTANLVSSGSDSVHCALEHMDSSGSISKSELQVHQVMPVLPATAMSNALPRKRPFTSPDLRRVDTSLDLRMDCVTPLLPLQERPSSRGFRDSIKRDYDSFLRESVLQGSPEEQATAQVEVQRLIRLERLGRPNDYNLRTWKIMMDRTLAHAAATALPGDEKDDEITEQSDDSQESTTSTASDCVSLPDDGQWTATQLDAIVEEMDSELELHEAVQIADRGNELKSDVEITEEAVEAHVPDVILLD